MNKKIKRIRFKNTPRLSPTSRIHLGKFPISSVQVILHKLPHKTILRLGEMRVNHAVWKFPPMT